MEEGIQGSSIKIQEVTKDFQNKTNTYKKPPFSTSPIKKWKVIKIKS